MSPQPFEPFTLGSLTLKNRFIVAPMATRYPDHAGKVTSVLLSYYAHLALCGAALVVAEAAIVSPDGRGWSKELSACHPSDLAGLSEIADTIRERGAIPFLQLHHAGRQGLPESDGTVIGPSAVPCPILNRPVRELTVSEIRDMVGKFVDAAKMARKAGFVGIELHGAHGYLLHQFVSPLTNFRIDEYGLETAGVSKFPLEVVREIKKAVPDLHISYRLSARDYLPKGLTLKGSRQLAKRLETEGVHLISVSGGMYASLHGTDSLVGKNSPLGVFRDDARDIREVVSVPVAVAGKIQYPNMAREILANNDAHLIALGRVLLRDPHWIQKAQDGEDKNVRPCLLCSRCHYHQKGCPDDQHKPVWVI